MEDARISRESGLSRRDRAFAAAGFLAALAIRLVFVFSAKTNYDMASWRIVLDIIHRGGNIYQETQRYNYSPLWAGVLLGLSHVASVLGITLERAILLFHLGVDGVSAALIAQIGRQRGLSAARARWGSLLFFANPLSVIVSNDRGMFDGFSILFLLGAILSVERKPTREPPVALWLAGSLLAKHITWFHPLLFSWRRRAPRISWIAALSAYLIFLASFLPFWRSWEAIRMFVFGYRGLDEPYGTEPLRAVSWLPHETTTILFVLAALAAVGMLRRVEIGRACLLLFLVILIFTPGICPYYFVWPVALGALSPSLGFGVYTVVLTAFFIHSPDVLAQEIPHLPGWWGAWWAVVFWLLWEIRSWRGTAAKERAA